MKIMVSACLIGENCKYNGKNNYSEKLAKFLEGHEVYSVCPEILGGFSTPRPPCEICNGKVITPSGTDVTEKYVYGAELGLNTAKAIGVEKVILQSRSPSCGVNQIYDGTFQSKKIEGKGIFAKLLIDNGFSVVDIEDL